MAMCAIFKSGVALCGTFSVVLCATFQFMKLRETSDTPRALIHTQRYALLPWTLMTTIALLHPSLRLNMMESGV